MRLGRLLCRSRTASPKRGNRFFLTAIAGRPDACPQTASPYPAQPAFCLSCIQPAMAMETVMLPAYKRGIPGANDHPQSGRPDRVPDKTKEKNTWYFQVFYAGTIGSGFLKAVNAQKNHLSIDPLFFLQYLKKAACMRCASSIHRHCHGAGS